MARDVQGLGEEKTIQAGDIAEVETGSISAFIVIIFSSIEGDIAVA